MESDGLQLLALWQIVTLLAGILVSIEVLLFSKLTILLGRLIYLLKKVFKLLSSSHTSDIRKEFLIVAYSKKILIYNLLFSVKILLALSPIVISFLVLFGSMEEALNAATSVSLMLFIVIASSIYLFLRTR